MKRMLDFLALPFTFFDAHDHSSSAVLSRPEMKPHEGYQPTPGEVGCYLSHRAVWELVVRHADESGDQQPALILEDDIDAEVDVVKIFVEVLESFGAEGAYLLPPHGASILLRTLVHVSLYPPPVIQLPRTRNEDSDVQPGNWVWARLPEQTLQRSTRKEAGIETTRK
ncbi:hypothetical protein M427DRAFT_32371 [Gonapodya prolifera JEL478]|uniref:Glycosyl transferase family 25 domain-containing protein n=1 Tax=Gonapodya prolifera (strain JEL478) TaxID=1344416 RepID=A0A139AFS1_GONPJ|nr:hypothetical protein M427DRAFT_32371 [Gonapodya prolifera JEL478]|eukprot:KXS15414.1 hypothetical protein M427DRAFT_32371 [Gonapodya prolifera JEL478]